MLHPVRTIEINRPTSMDTPQGPVFIPLRLEYVRFLIEVAQTAYLSEAIHEAATSSGEEAFGVQISD